MKTSPRLLGVLCSGLLAALIPASTLHATFAKGADVSYLPQMEANGYIWKDKKGAQKDLLVILKDYQIDSIRLRTWVNPSSDSHAGHCSISETAALAKRCKALGYRIMIDFHFSDSWTSKGTQKPPAAWANMTYSQMLQAMNDYVYHSMNVLKSNGISPEWVQIGNEENLGICTPTGSVSSNPAQMTGLLNAAYNMVKLVSPSTKVIIHLASPQDLSANEAWFDKYKAVGGKWDICGFSSYPSSSLVSNLVADIKTMGQRYGKEVMVVETGGPVTNPNESYNVVNNYIDGMRAISSTQGGVFYWEPERYAPWTDGATQNGAWDSTTKRPTHAMDAFLN